jgi:hypothetical protein
MMEAIMNDTAALSALRRTLCSRGNALRVARRMMEHGIDAVVVASHDPLQPWRVTERDNSIVVRECA